MSHDMARPLDVAHETVTTDEAARFAADHWTVTNLVIDLQRTLDFTDALTGKETSNDTLNGSGNAPDSPSGTDNLTADGSGSSSGTVTLNLHQTGTDTAFTQTIHQLVTRDYIT